MWTSIKHPAALLSAVCSCRQPARKLRAGHLASALLQAVQTSLTPLPPPPHWQLLDLDSSGISVAPQQKISLPELAAQVRTRGGCFLGGGKDRAPWPLVASQLFNSHTSRTL